jgi:hypothetical protein
MLTGCASGGCLGICVCVFRNASPVAALRAGDPFPGLRQRESGRVRPARRSLIDQPTKERVCERAGRSGFAVQNRSGPRKARMGQLPATPTHLVRNLASWGAFGAAALCSARCGDGGACGGCRGGKRGAAGPLPDGLRALSRRCQEGCGCSEGTPLARRCGDVRSRCPPALTRVAFEKEAALQNAAAVAVARHAKRPAARGICFENGWNRAVAPASTYMAREPGLQVEQSPWQPGRRAPREWQGTAGL